MLFVAALLALPLVAPLPAAASSAGAAAIMATPGRTLAAHHAVYELTLKSSVDQGVLSARGTMTYDLTDACTGMSTTQHLSIDLTDRDGRDINMVSDYATFETFDGTRLEFHTRQLTGNETTESLDGTAVLDRSGGRGHADYTSPDHKRVMLPTGTLLPNAHTLSILQAGSDGQRFLASVLFDGTDSGGAQDSFVTIQPWQNSRSDRWSALSLLPSRRTHVAFFSREPGTQTPDYEVGMRYYANGVADDLAMNFGDFVMAGHLTALDLKPPPRC